MVSSLMHRGPDESGFWNGSDSSLGISRLSIIDVAGGHQPAFSADRSVVVVCNGEIYNYRELARDLVASGTVLRSSSDVEVIPHLYRQYGLEFISHLRGMFALALWDDIEKCLVLARDRVGKKPLIFAQDGEGLIFASEARAIRAAGWRKSVDLTAIDHVLAFGYLPPDRGALTGMRKLPPGHLAIWRGGQLEMRQYWGWKPSPEKFAMSGIGSTVESVVDEAVRIRLVSERPLGAFLSGGIDSTIITALMTRHHNGRVKTYSIGFADPAFDESKHARAVADYLGTDHTEFVVEHDPEMMIAKLAESFDQPFADSSAIPTLLLSELAANDVVVALSGDGGDEGFGGYVRYRAAPALQRANPLLGLTSTSCIPLASWADRTGRQKLGRLVRQFRFQPNLRQRYLGIMGLIPLELRRILWTPEAQSTFSVESADTEFAQSWDRFAGLSSLDQMRAVDMSTYLPGDLLTKVDTASMACSLEVRSPFLDQEVLALAARIPQRAMIRGRSTKWILRELAYRLIPRELVDRPKRGFAIPQAAWLRGPLREMSRDLLLDRTAQQRGWFKPNVVRDLLDVHDSGFDQDRQIWPMLMIEVWARRWLDSDAQQLSH